MPPPPKKPQASLPPPIHRFLRLSLALTVLCLFVEVFCARILHAHYPYTWPLMPALDPFRDFYLYEPRFTFFHSPAFFTYQGWEYLYPAPLSVVYRLFYFLPHSTECFLATLSASFLAATILLGRALAARGLALPSVFAILVITVLCSYPFFFEFEQANLEFIVWIFIASGLWAFLRGRGYTAAACFGIAGAMKIFPLVFLGLFLSRRQYRELATTLLTTALTTLATLWLLCPNLAVSWHGTQAGVARFRELYILRYSEVGFDHSLFALPKAMLGFSKFFTHSPTPPGPEALARMLAVYLPLFALVGVVLYFTLIRRLPVINQVLCLFIASILLPPVSYDYTLIHLYAPWALLLLFTVETRDRFTPGLTAAFTCFAILLAPETEIILHKHSFGGQIKAITLVALMVIALRKPFRSSYDDWFLIAQNPSDTRPSNQQTPSPE